MAILDATKEAAKGAGEGIKNFVTGAGRATGIKKVASSAATKGVGAALTVTETMGKMMNLLDDQLTQAARSRDNAEANQVLGGLHDQATQLRSAVSQLTPDQQKIYQQQLKGLISDKAYRHTDNPLYNAKQLVTTQMAALTRAKGEDQTDVGARAEQALQKQQAGNAVSKLGTLGHPSEEQAYRDSAGGTALGISSGRTDISQLPKGTQTAARAGRALANPSEALIAGYKALTGDENAAITSPKEPGKLTSDLLDRVNPPKQTGLVGTPADTAFTGDAGGFPKKEFAPKGPPTYEDLIQTALTKAGLTSQVPKPGTYDSITGIPGTNTAAMADRALIGTHEAKNAFVDSQLNAQKAQANLENNQRAGVVGLGTAAYTAQQQAQAMAAGAALNREAKGAVTPAMQYRGAITQWSALNKAANNPLSSPTERKAAQTALGRHEQLMHQVATGTSEETPQS